MGKSWKFMTSSKERPKSHKQQTEYQWSTQAFTLKEIVSSFRLPTIVLCNVESCTVLWSNFYFELKQPLLLYSRQQSKKACAWCLRKNQQTGRYSQFGPPVVIPEDYDGWFQLIRGENDRPFQFNSIEAIATSLADNFLCATESQGFLVHGKQADTMQFTQRTIAAGEILKKIGIYVGDVTVHNEVKGGQPEVIEMKYLKCTDDKNEEVVVPFTQKGKFYAVSYNISYNSGLVQVKEIVRKSDKFPIFAQHIYGDPPALSYNYTGQLQFYDSMQEETVMAATMTRDRVRPLELQMNSPIRFRIALNEAQVRPKPEFIKALEMCQGLGQKYIRDMKIAFTLKPASTSLDDIDLSLYNMNLNEETLRQSSSLEIESDLGEAIDANSEFEIDWGPPMPADGKSKTEPESRDNSDSHVRFDVDGYYVDSIEAALDGEDFAVSSDEETTDNTLIINHGRLKKQEKSNSRYSIESDGSEDTDIFYDDEYLENCMTVDDIQKSPESFSDNLANDCQYWSGSHNAAVDQEESVQRYDEDKCPENISDGNESEPNESLQLHRDDTGYVSDHKEPEEIPQNAVILLDNDADSEVMNTSGLSLTQNKVKENIDSDTAILGPRSGSKDIYDTIENGTLLLLEGSAQSGSGALFRYDWGDEFV